MMQELFLQQYVTESDAYIYVQQQINSCLYDESIAPFRDPQSSPLGAGGHKTGTRVIGSQAEITGNIGHKTGTLAVPRMTNKDEGLMENLV